MPDSAPTTVSPSGRPPRRETFLARYPRKLKLGVAIGTLSLMLTPWLTSLTLDMSNYVAQKEHLRPLQILNSFTPASVTPAAAPGNNVAAAPGAAASETDIIASNDTDDRATRMARAPVPGLTEETPEGSLPRIGEDGRAPWQVYARPFNSADKRPRIAIVLTGVGLSRLDSDSALARLPASVTFAFDAQSPVVGSWLGRARQDGHETLLDVPMEPFDYPGNDPGPNTLLTNQPNANNLQRLYHALRQGTGYVGITTLSGSRFTATPDKISPILRELRQRGLIVFDAHVALHSTLKDLAHALQLPVAIGNQQIDQTPTPAAIDDALNQLEQTARLTGHAIGIASPLPITLDHLEAWIKQLPSHGIALAPLSAMVE